MSTLRQTSLLCCLGTRPEVIKMAPVIQAFRQTDWARCRVLVTAQHRELLDQMLETFEIVADGDLNIMRANQALAELTAALLTGLDSQLAQQQPDIVLAQGDTTTVFCTALACFYRGIPFGHVEAGLRTGNLRSPFPEEANRVLCSRLAALNFAPTATARDHLLEEGVAASSIFVTGNPVIDALRILVDKDTPLGVEVASNKRLVLVTAHRRENFGQPLRNICLAVAQLSQQYPDVQFLWPIHPNPAVKPLVESLLSKSPGVMLTSPLDYARFVTAMRRSVLLLTDSGGLQEEGPALGKPVLVMREVSERPEALQSGASLLVGTETERIVSEVSRLLDDPAAYHRMVVGYSPYGDGRASSRIVSAVGRHFGHPVSMIRPFASVQGEKAE